MAPGVSREVLRLLDARGVYACFNMREAERASQAPIPLGARGISRLSASATVS